MSTESSNDSPGIKKMDPKEFRELGFLQELNRCFLHPLGLALEIEQDENTGEERFGGVWDYREDPEGMEFDPAMLDAGKATHVMGEYVAHMEVRRARFGGAVIQPIPDLPS